jgi:hypothetical protein
MKLTVDLASKFSAAMVVDRSGQVLCEFNSVGLSSIEFAEQCAQTALDYEVTEAIFEDVPYGIKGQGQVKAPFRLQGIIIDEMAKVDLLDCTFFLNPSTWMNHFPGVARAPKGMSKADGTRARYAAARKHAAAHGYSPPPLVQNYIDSLPEGTRVLKKNTDPLLKSETDHIDAYLIATWANSFETQEELRAKMQEPNI